MKIVISKISGYFPNDHSQQLYVDVRSVKQGLDHLIVETDEKHQIKNDTSYRNRKIQSVFYDQYTVEFITTESVGIELLNFAEEIIITQDDGEQHTAEIINFQPGEKIQNTEFRLYNLIYRDLNSKEVINHLDVFNLTDGIIKFKSGITNSYSKIYPKFAITDYDRTENDDNYIKSISSDSAFKTIEFIAYLSQGEINNIKTGLSAVYLDTFEMVYNETTYSALEVPELIVEDSEMEDRYPVRVIMKYEQILNYPYA